MRAIWYGEGDLAWFEPENEGERGLVARANREGWSTARLQEEMARPSKIAEESAS